MGRGGFERAAHVSDDFAVLGDDKPRRRLRFHPRFRALPSLLRRSGRTGRSAIGEGNLDSVNRPQEHASICIRSDMHVGYAGHELATMTEVTVPDAIESYLTERAHELSDSSIQNHRYQLEQFRRWCAGPGEIDSLDDLEPLTISQFRRYRSSELNSNTMYNQLSVVRLMLRFAHRMGWVREELPESIVLPTRAGRARDRSIDPDRITSLLDELEKYHYASFDHVLLSLLWTCSLRIGAVRALDVDDLHLDEQWIEMIHRPETDTPLKNGDDSEREINLHGWVCDMLRAWVEDRRPDVNDEHDRTPLLATRHGRTRDPQYVGTSTTSPIARGSQAGVTALHPMRSAIRRSRLTTSVEARSQRGSMTVWM